MTAQRDIPLDGDDLYRDRARRMADALRVYADWRQAALQASLDGDKYSAKYDRAEARACLHEHPELLALVEPER